MDKGHGTDAEGFIKTMPAVNLQPEFESVVGDVCSTLVEALGTVVDSIYLYGSVARGQARPGESDLDVTLLINGQIELYNSQLERIKEELEERHPEVTKIDFDVGTRTETLAPENHFSWGYWLKHHCRCVWGSDLSSEFQRFKPSREIAMAVNGDFARVLRQYATSIECTTDTEQLLRLQREASRKLIRSTNILRLDQEQSWPLSLEDYVELFLRVAPEMKHKIEYFLRHARAPDSEANTFSTTLRSFIGWMLEGQARRGTLPKG
ncbi:nucleotidyltransferase domain-containing protein [Pseudomonas gregormendelii]|uniref:Nucleotidyltransferase domain-containing protein n=1 Tax=Pseudomonas gregormendelii TaxID=1628277 RepID=A0ABS3AGN1_9PSED|nr:nucleotidyltransferase domain-containing protein [Pseudomonas gregormendelii]MBN3965394.1 nucleotidyltransferase domain-containing protein [Pseudomonas gregormendelii]